MEMNGISNVAIEIKIETQLNKCVCVCVWAAWLRYEMRGLAWNTQIFHSLAHSRNHSLIRSRLK